MDQSHQTERDLVCNASNRWEPASCPDAVAEAEQLITRKGERQVLDIDRTWIAVQGALRIQNAPVAEPLADVIPDHPFAATAAL